MKNVGDSFELADGSTGKVKAKLGSGGYGQVFHVEINKDGVIYNFAVKQALEGKTLSTPILKRTQNSPYFLQNYGVSKDGKIQLSELGQKSLDDFTEFRVLKIKKIRAQIFHDIFDAISVLHEKKMVCPSQKKQSPF